MSYFISISILFITLLLYFILNNKDKLSHIPGPKGKPIFGNLLDLKSGDLHLKFQEWYYKYGSIFKIRMGKIDTIVLTEYSTIKEAFVDNSLIFMPRFQRESRRLTSNWESLINANGDKQKHLKVLMMSELTSSKLKKMEYNLKDEAKRLCSLLDQFVESGEPFVINNYIKMFSTNVILRFLFGVSFPYSHLEDSIGLLGVVNDYFDAAALPIVSDFIPMFAPLSNKQKEKFKEAYQLLYQHVIEQIEVYKKRKLIDDNLKQQQQQQQQQQEEEEEKVNDDGSGDENSTILDKLLKDYEAGIINENSFIGTVIDLMAAGIDTSANTMIFSIIELTNHQDCQDKLYRSIKDSISSQDFTSDEGISYSKYKSSIPYLTNVTKEISRLYPAGLLGLPHITSEDCTIRNYFIPKGTQVIQNIYSSHRNKNIWSDPDTFIPSRFDSPLSSEHTLFQFALGRRSCPGSTLADSEIFTCLATLFKKYRFINPSNTSLSVTGKFGVAYISPSTTVKIERR